METPPTAAPSKAITPQVVPVPTRRSQRTRKKSKKARQATPPRPPPRKKPAPIIPKKPAQVDSSSEESEEEFPPVQCESKHYLLTHNLNRVVSIVRSKLYLYGLCIYRAAPAVDADGVYIGNGYRIR
jgi:hypothetical protein